MKLTNNTFVSVGGVMQGIGAPDEDRSGGFDRGGWTTPLFDNEAGTRRSSWSNRGPPPGE